MIASVDDARLLFARWREEAPPLRAKLMNGALILEGTGTVLDFTPLALQIGGASWQLTIPLHDARFTFSDPREIAVQAVRALETEKYEFGLAIDMANGDRLALMELKESPADDGADE
jgi:hypothetical protein